MIPEAMQGATDFEIYVWKYQSVHTIGEMRRAWDASLRDIRDAMDKGCRLNWSAIPMKQIPDITPPKPITIHVSKQEARKKHFAAIWADIYKRYQEGETYCDLAQQYKYSIRTIYDIISKAKKQKEQEKH